MKRVRCPARSSRGPLILIAAHGINASGLTANELVEIGGV